MIRDYFRFAIKSIRYKKIRSWLTILGVVVGIILITSLVSLGEGLKTAVLSQLRMLGGDIIYVLPGEETNPLLGLAGGYELSKDDVGVVENVEGVEMVVPMFYKTMLMEYKGEKKLVAMCGHPQKETLELLEEFQGWSLYKGDWPETDEDLAVGYSVGVKAFKEEMEIGQKVKVGERELKVTGIVNKFGEQTVDTMVNVELETLRQITGEKEAVHFMMVQTKSGEDIDQVATGIKTKLKKQRGAEDFTVMTSAKAAGIVGNVIGTIEWVVVGIAVVALIVGGIGIMTAMYTSVHERTKEIGIMKAIGAKNRSILFIFLFEAGFIGLVGGVIGLIFGFGLAKMVELVAHQKGFVMLEASVTLELVILGLLFSFVIGCVSGVLPARQAAKLKPVDALRYE